MPAIEINEQLLDKKLTDLETARQWSPRVIAKLESMIRTADDYAIFRINPVQFALEKGIAENEAIDLFLYGTKYGLFEMDWHLVCAMCAHVVKSFRDLTNLHSHIVKTIGDAIMATFMNPVNAVAAAIELLQEIEKFNHTISDDIILKIGIHRGPSIVVALNDRLDYFGQTVNIAVRVQGLAGADEIYISGDAHHYPGVDKLLEECEVVAQQALVKGVSDFDQAERSRL